MVQGTVRDCRHGTGDGQRLQTWYRRRSETADILPGTADIITIIISIVIQDLYSTNSFTLYNIKRQYSNNTDQYKSVRKALLLGAYNLRVQETV
ncbi:unnamed protein product, partial [Staurois parvus]